MEKKKKDTLRQLLAYAGNYKGLTFLGMALSAIAMVLGMLPYHSFPCYTLPAVHQLLYSGLR